VDIAYVDKGYVYHTEYDSMEQVSEGTVERAGLNLLGLVTHLASQHLDTQLTSEVVFFDVFGLFMLRYSSLTGVLLNLLSVVVTLIISSVDIWISFRREQTPGKDAVKLIAIFVFGVFLLGVNLALAFSALVAYLLALLGCDMSWFSSPTFLLVLYAVPSFILLLLPEVVLFRRFLKTYSKQLLLNLHLQCQAFWFALICMLLTSFSVKSAFLFSFPLFLFSIWLLLDMLFLKERRTLSLIIFNLLQIPHLLLFCYVIQLVYIFFIPVMGRKGTDDNPDLQLGLLTSVFTILLLHMSIPFLSLMKAKAKLIVGGLLGLVFLFGLLLLLLSDLGFPYTSKEGDRRPQRLTIYHSQLVDGTGGFYVHRSDYHWAAKLEDSVPAYKNATWVSRGSCNDSRRMSMVCVMPEANLKDLWIEAAPPAPPQETSLAWEKQVGNFIL